MKCEHVAGALFCLFCGASGLSDISGTGGRIFQGMEFCGR
jgi:hypothetical protein